MIEKLEMKELTSITKTPRTTAACLNNIKRCLTFLRDSKAKVNPNELYCEQMILEGCPSAIATVIDQLYKAYNIKISKIDQKM